MRIFFFFLFRKKTHNKNSYFFLSSFIVKYFFFLSILNPSCFSLFSFIFVFVSFFVSIIVCSPLNFLLSNVMERQFVTDVYCAWFVLVATSLLVYLRIFLPLSLNRKCLMKHFPLFFYNSHFFSRLARVI